MGKTEGMPTKEGVDFLVLYPNKTEDGFAWKQVYWFEGSLYPEELGWNVNWTDALDVTFIEAWSNLPDKKTNQTKELTMTNQTKENTMNDQVINAWAVEVNGEIWIEYLSETRREAREYKRDIEWQTSDNVVKVVKVQVKKVV